MPPRRQNIDHTPVACPQLIPVVGRPKSWPCPVAPQLWARTWVVSPGPCGSEGRKSQAVLQLDVNKKGAHAPVGVVQVVGALLSVRCCMILVVHQPIGKMQLERNN